MGNIIQPNTSYFREIEGNGSREFRFLAGKRDRLTFVLQRSMDHQSSTEKRLPRRKDPLQPLEGAKLIVRHNGKEHVSERDDISFLTLGDDGFNLEEIDHSGEYEIIIETRKAANIVLYVAKFDMTPPSELIGKLTPPYGKFKGMPSELMSPFGSVWGGLTDEHIPFFLKYLNYFHLGGDFSMNAGQKVVAAAPGRIVKVNSSGPGWGFHIGIDHAEFGFLYEHLEENKELEAQIKAGEIIDVEAGEEIGRIHDLNSFQGEPNHLHLCGTRGGIIQGSSEDLANQNLISSAVGAAHIEKIGSARPMFFNPMDPRLYRGL